MSQLRERFWLMVLVMCVTVLRGCQLTLAKPEVSNVTLQKKKQLLKTKGCVLYKEFV